jgi:hypothetical protein
MSYLQAEGAGRSRIRRMNTRWLCLQPPEQLDEDPPLETAHALMQRVRKLVQDRDPFCTGSLGSRCVHRELLPFVGFTRAAPQLIELPDIEHPRPRVFPPAARGSRLGMR